MVQHRTAAFRTRVGTLERPQDYSPLAIFLLSCLINLLNANGVSFSWILGLLV